MGPNNDPKVNIAPQMPNNGISDAHAKQLHANPLVNTASRLPNNDEARRMPNSNILTMTNYFEGGSH